MASNTRRKAPTGGGLGTALAPHTQSLPQLLASLQPSDTSVAAAANNTGVFSGATAKCRGEFCRVAPAALRGLYGTSIENNDGEDDATSTPRRRQLQHRDAALPDDGQRLKMGNNNLLLARAEMAFIMGSATTATGLDPEERILQWQEADNLHRTELGRTNPNAYYKQVAVCRNCHRIYTDVANFRELGFRWHAKKTAWDNDDSSDKRGAAVKASKRAAGRAEENKRQRSERAVEKAGTPEDDSALDFDRLFLAELAKHDGTDAATTTSTRLESRGEKGHTQRVEPVLPTLGMVAKTKKTRPTVDAGASARLTSNQQQPSQLRTPIASERDPMDQMAMNEASGSPLEGVVCRLREELATEQARTKSVEAQRQLLEQKLVQMQSLMQDKEDEFRKRILEVELQSMEKKRSTGSDSSTPSSAADVGQLIETIESLHQQLDHANQTTDTLRRELIQSHHGDVKRLHEKYQLEMETLRLSEHTAKEQTEALHMQMTHWQGEAQVAASQAKSARAALDELTKSKLPLLEEKTQRLERQLRELKSTPTSSSSSSPVTVSSSSVTASTQDMAAMEKHLNNKVEYLKAQLASEMKCKEELGSHLASITASLEALKKEKRAALADQDEAHKRHLERVEANFALEKDTLCAQQASMQGKNATLQANVTDLVQELTIAKSRETNTKLALEKLAEENVRLTRQLVDMESLLETLQEERKRDGQMSAKNASEETQRMQMEALLRRLDNERQYLKNQVDNEAELKTQSQRHVQTLEGELRDVRAATDEMTKLAEHTISGLQADKSNLERQLRDEKAALDETKSLLSRQLKDVQTKFMHTREQSLLDKDELEKSRIEIHEARAQLIAAREEVVNEKEYGKTASDRMSKALATIKSSLKAVEDDRNLRIQRLDDEIAMYMEKLAKSQGDLLVLETKWSDDKRSFKRQQALAKVWCLVTRKVEARHVTSQAAAFWQLKCSATMAAARGQLMSAHRVELMDQENRLRHEFMDKCDEMTQALHGEREQALTAVKSVYDQDKDELKQFYDQEKAQLEEDLRHLHARQMHELEEQYDHTIKCVDEQSAAALSALQRRCEDLQRERDEARAALEETKQRCEQLGAAVGAREGAALADLKERQRLWYQEKKAMAEAHEQQLEQLKEDLEQQQHELLKAQQTQMENERGDAERRYEETTTQMRATFESVIAEKEQQLTLKHVDEIQCLKQQHAIDFDQEKLQITASWQKELDRERAGHEKALKEALERVESKTQGHLESVQKEMNDRKANALLQTTAKWQKAMEELQARLEIEKKVAYDSGVQDRETEWQQAALLIKQKQKDELDSVQNEAVRAIQAAEERHGMLLQAQLRQMRKEFGDKHVLELEKLQTEIQRTEQVKYQHEMAAAMEKQQRGLEAQYDQAIKTMREQLTDGHRTDMARLESRLADETEKLIATHATEQQALLERMELAYASKLETLEKTSEAHTESVLAQQRTQLLDEFDVVRHEMRDAFDAELADKLKEQEERLLNDQDDAITHVQEDSEKLIEQVEVAMTELKKQKEALESELSRLRNALEEAEDAHFDVAENLKKQQKTMVFQLLALAMHATKALEQAKQTHTQQLLEVQTKHDQLDTMLQREKNQWARDVAAIRDTWTQVQSRHGDMLQTLTNYKRDELVAHRSASSVLSNEISIVAKQMDEVTDMKRTLEHEIEQLQHEAQGVEASVRQLMLPTSSSSSSSSSSSTSDGSLNMAVIAKKRRLNEEFEALLEHMERKKAEVRNMDKTLASLRHRRDEKESELKTMERKLVEILVGQQKQMLSLLHATREVAQLPTPLVAKVAAS